MRCWRQLEADEARIVAAAPESLRAPPARRQDGPPPGLAASAAAAAALALALALALIAVIGQLTLARAGKILAHFIEAGLVALALDLADVRRGEGERQLLRCEVQVAAGDLVLAHVEVGIPGITCGARRERR